MTIIFLNGNYVEGGAPLISHRDCGFTTGIGVFDSMLAIDGKPVYSVEHYDRLIHDAKMVIGLTPDLPLSVFQEVCNTLLEKNNLTTDYARIRTTITGGEVDAPLAAATTATILIEVKTCNNPDDITPVKCSIITEFPRIAGCDLEKCKRLDYSRSYAARRKAESLGGDEAILTNTEGNIACGATSNLFIEENGVLTTPPLSDGVLAGITRRKLIEERNVKEDSISIDRLQSANAIYLTNSFIGLRKAIL